MKRPSSALMRLLLPLVGLMLVGCSGNNMSDLRSFVAEVKSRKAGDIEPLPEIKPIETFVYEGGDDRRNPFRPVEQEREAMVAADTDGLSPDPNRRREELESYSLDSMRMVGTLAQSGTMWALVRTKDETIYRVKAGNYIGRNHGHITHIDENDIELTEIVSNGQGGYRERQASLTMKE